MKSSLVAYRYARFSTDLPVMQESYSRTAYLKSRHLISFDPTFVTALQDIHDFEMRSSEVTKFWNRVKVLQLWKP